MSTVLLLSGSPSPDSRTGVLLGHTDSWLAPCGHDVQTLHVRDLPTSALLVSNTEHPAIRAAVGASGFRSRSETRTRSAATMQKGPTVVPAAV